MPPRLLGRAEAVPADEPDDVVHCTADYLRYDDVASLLERADLVVRGTVTAERVFDELPLVEGAMTPELAQELAIASTSSTLEVHEVVRGDLGGRRVVEVGATGTRVASATSCASETPLAVGTEHVLVVDVVDLDRPVHPLNPYEATFEVTGDGALVAASREEELAVDSVEDLRRPAGG